MSDRPAILPWLLVLSAVGLAIYAVGIGAPYYADDFQFVFAEPASDLVRYFHEENPTNPLYRPIQSSYLALVQSVFGLNTAPVQLLQLALHVLLGVLVFHAMLGLGFAALQARIGSLWLVVSQTNVHAVVSNDTLSQVGGTLFGCLGVWWTLRACRQRGDGTLATGPYALALVALALSLWSKESSVSYVAIMAGVVALEAWRRDGLRGIGPRTVLRVVPIGALGLAYLAIRSQVVSAQPHWGAGDYAFRIGENVIANIGLFVFGAFLPGNSVTVAVAAKSGDPVVPALMGAGALLLAGLVGWGLWHAAAERRGVLAAVATFGTVAMFPMALMNHVSELYLYNAMPFLVVLGGAGLGRLFTRWDGVPIRRKALAAVCVVALAGQGVAVVQKASMMKRQGQRAGHLLAQITPHARALPAGGRLVLHNPPGAEPGYSSFKSAGFLVLRKGTHRIRALAGRDDIEVDIVDRLPVRADGPCLVLSVSADDRVAIDAESRAVCDEGVALRRAGGYGGVP